MTDPSDDVADAYEDLSYLARSSNRVAVLSALHDGPATRAELLDRLGFSRMTLDRTVEAFAARNWVRTEGVRTSRRRGRRHRRRLPDVRTRRRVRRPPRRPPGGRRRHLPLRRRHPAPPLDVRRRRRDRRRGRERHPARHHPQRTPRRPLLGHRDLRTLPRRSDSTDDRRRGGRRRHRRRHDRQRRSPVATPAPSNRVPSPCRST